MTKPVTSKPFGPTVAVEYNTPRKLSPQECKNTQANIAYTKRIRGERPQWVNGLEDHLFGWTKLLGTKNAITQSEIGYRQGGCPKSKAK